MSYDTHEMEFFTRLYRFAWILLKRDDVVRKIVLDALEEIHIRGMHAHEDLERMHARAFQVVRQRALKVPTSGLTASPGGALGWPVGADLRIANVMNDAAVDALHQVAEPGRSALALLLLDAVDLESMERILGLSVTQLADVLDQARGATARALALYQEASV